MRGFALLSLACEQVSISAKYSTKRGAIELFQNVSGAIPRPRQSQRSSRSSRKASRHRWSPCSRARRSAWRAFWSSCTSKSSRFGSGSDVKMSDQRCFLHLSRVLLLFMQLRQQKAMQQFPRSATRPLCDAEHAQRPSFSARIEFTGYRDSKAQGQS